MGEDGPTHHGVFDLSFLREIPQLVIAAPADENELQHLLKTAFEAKCPFVLRYPRGAGFNIPLDDEPKALPLGKGKQLRKGKDGTILAIGNRVHPALEAAELLAAKGLDYGVVNMRFVKPLDTKSIDAALKVSPHLITVEDNALAGGFGSAVAEYLADTQAHFKLLRLGYPDQFVEHGKAGQLYAAFSLDAQTMAKKILNWTTKGEYL